MRNRIICAFKTCAAIMLTVAMASCTKYETPADIIGNEAQKNDSTVITKQTRFVLWVNIDGARGSLVKQAVENGDMPTLKAMLEHSKYAFTGLADDHDLQDGARVERAEEDPVTWASMLTGVNSRANRVTGYSYQPDFDINEGNPTSSTATYYPNVLGYLTKYAPQLSTACVVSWGSISRFLDTVNSNTQTESDEETVQTLKQSLVEKDYNLTISNLKNVQLAGVKGGFTLSNPDYLAALKNADSQLEGILDAMKQRENYVGEDWLVCVTSDHGGTDDGKFGGSTDAERDIFGVFYYDHYKPYEMKGETVYAARFSSDDYAIIYDTLANYTTGRDKEFSLEFQMRNTPRVNASYTGNNWNAFISKGSNWGAYRQRNTVSLRMTGGDKGALEYALSAANDAKIHHFYMGVNSIQSGYRKFLISYDGRRQKYGDTQMQGGQDSSKIYVGRNGIPSPFYVTTIRIWNKILSDADVDAMASKLKLDADDKNRQYLAAEWRLSPDEIVCDTLIPNSVKGMPGLSFITKPRFVKIANTLPAKLSSGDLVMENTLVLPQILYWLCGVSAIDSRLDGYNFLSSYSNEEQWRSEQ